LEPSSSCAVVSAAAELLDAGVEAARLPGYPEVLVWSLTSRSHTATAAGETATALACAEEAMEMARTINPGPLVPWCGAALAAALLAAGEPRRATEELVAAGGGERLADIHAPWRANYLELLTRCWLASGRPDEAARAAACADAAADTLDLRLPRAMADRALAAVSLDRGDAATAARRALESAATADDVGALVEGALSRVLAGRSLAAAGDRERASAELKRAAADLEACGAPAQRAAAERELGRLGLRPHRRTRPGTRDGSGGVDSLTGRELEVARLVVDRRTNAQIAAELFLSEKTVESHIRHLFEKLSVNSRVEVARVVERADRERERSALGPR
jgi:DNA-binding CsgD family transcriptional regulator